MSFYGKQKRVNSSPFIFDKIYPNRVEMEAQKTTDNIYIGRYVLVKYTFKGINDKCFSSNFCFIFFISFLCNSNFLFLNSS